MHNRYLFTITARNGESERYITEGAYESEQEAMREVTEHYSDDPYMDISDAAITCRIATTADIERAEREDAFLEYDYERYIDSRDW